jgi:hypothetical protein
MKTRIPSLLLWVLGILLLASCAPPAQPPTPTTISRKSALPPGAVKIHPADDPHPPILHHPDWEAPIPLPGPINTAGGEDAPFIPADGKRLFFFFTPDVSVPAEGQLQDGATGIYLSTRTDQGWSPPERLVLSEDLALDGCPFALGSRLWFCSARAGSTGVGWYTAESQAGSWKNWQPADFNPEHQVGEFHLSANGTELYFGSDRSGTLGASDLWFSQLVDGAWSEPENLRVLNSPADESRPFLTGDGEVIWFTRTYQGSPAVFRSRRAQSGWEPPELILSRFAGEPTLDPQGNIYFVHHYYVDGEMVEVDLYLAKKK